jgi:hypothetical protein
MTEDWAAVAVVINQLQHNSTQRRRGPRGPGFLVMGDFPQGKH